MKTERPPARAKRPPFWIPLLVAAGLSLCFWLWDLDFLIMDRFGGAGGSFTPKREGFNGLLYRFGPIPVLVVAISGLAVAVLAVSFGRVRPWWRAGLFWALSMIIGPGIIVNSIFKQNWGRPRPVQIERYGGDYQYVPLWSYGGYEDGTAFPSGHASMGFIWFAGYFVFYNRRRGLAVGFLMFGIFSGLLIGYARMAQGGHWPSDVLWSAVFCYFTGYGLYLVFRPDRRGEETGMPYAR